MNFLYVPFIFQAVIIGIDERLHGERGLGAWERFGHPLDTLSVVLPLVYASGAPITDDRLKVFIGLSLFSCFFITKDEFVHAKECTGFENWLHALLFVIHPMIFLCTGLFWKYDPGNPFLSYQPFGVAAFMVYQILRWSIPWKTIKK